MADLCLSDGYWSHVYRRVTQEGWVCGECRQGLVLGAPCVRVMGQRVVIRYHCYCYSGHPNPRTQPNSSLPFLLKRIPSERRPLVYPGVKEEEGEGRVPNLSSSKLDSIPYYNPGTARSEVQLGKRLFCEQMMQKLNLPAPSIKTKARRRHTTDTNVEPRPDEWNVKYKCFDFKKVLEKPQLKSYCSSCTLEFLGCEMVINVKRPEKERSEEEEMSYHDYCYLDMIDQICQ